MDRRDRLPDFPCRLVVRPLTPEEGDGHLVEFPDLPGCMADGDTLEEALRNAEDAMRCWLEASREAGRPVPEPQTAAVS